MSMTLLVVDDDDDNREPLCNSLTDTGYKTLAAAREEQVVLDEEPLIFAGFSLDPIKHLLTRPDGQSQPLPRSDCRVLCELLQADSRVVSRDQLTRSAFGRDHLPDDRSVDMCISRLRQQLRRAPAAGAQILTIRNQGYLLSLGSARSGS
ncbi:winged helix-turn-helix domain-containing protein [Pseudomonas sp. UFMG81]|uniref:winged helix-turn-helix domain-containing protein n=1 Tax=Pseudomonas sp. UFMG81 TaxID=2745936 RepID=UPI00188F0266|nr:winged helix-turn-helix domain-containing protein [Pseudomonas sp. UFMG81]